MTATSETPDEPNSPTESPADLSKTGRFEESAGSASPTHAVTADHLPTIDRSAKARTLTSAGTEHFGTLVSAEGIIEPPASFSIPGYEILGELGRGGMGVVYKARQIRAERLVALKLMLHAGHAGSKARERFGLEVQAVARFQHPNIVQLYEVGEADGLPYFTLEFVPGGTLSKKIDLSLLSVRETATFMVILARAIGYAHRAGVVHRDLKPGNVLLAADGSPKIADFGLARKLGDDTHLTHTGAVVGTPSYMAPEQASAETSAIGPAADIYALGAILYELLTGRPPFVGATVLDIFDQVRNSEPLPPSALQPRVPRDLETICLKCLQKDPAKRYTTADELAADLERFGRGAPIKARRISPAARAIRWCRRNPAPTAVVALSLLAAVLAGWAAITISAQKGTLTKQKNALAEQYETIKSQNQDIIAKQEALVAKEKLASARLEVNRGLVSAFAQDAPSVADNHPLAQDLKADITQLVIRLLNESQDQADVGTLTQRGLLTLATREGDLARIQKKLNEAEAHYQKALHMAEEVVKTETKEKDKAQSNLSFAYIKQGELAQDRKKHSEAIDWYKRSLAIRQQIAERPQTGELDPADCSIELGRIRVKLAEAYFADKQYAKAFPEAQAGLERIERYAAGVTDKRRSEMVNRDLALALMLVGNLAFRTEQQALGHECFKRAIDILERQSKANPDSLTPHYNLSKAYSEYGDWLYMKADQPREALKYFDRAQKQNRLLCGSRDVVNVEQTGLALGYYRLGLAAEMSGDATQAKKYFTRCRDLRETRVREVEEEYSFISTNRKVIDAKIDRMLAQARCQQVAEVTKMVEQLLALAALEKVNPKDQMHVAEAKELKAHYLLFAGCGLNILARYMTPSDPKRAEFTKKAVECIGLAVDNGFDNLWFLGNDADLEAIRPDPAYQAILERLRQKQKSKP
ncbi:MAG TPA: serine/threonine-protein kinase [Gemmataceae bacterium]|jgi:serine/threonine-protein kinase|nr:serine/threonine-protein kinase [Gemmataceae bacterium]